jgi:hypothetical protein
MLALIPEHRIGPQDLTLDSSCVRVYQEFVRVEQTPLRWVPLAVDTISVPMAWADARHISVMDECRRFTQAEASLEALFVEETQFNTLCILREKGEVRSRAGERGP